MIKPPISIIHPMKTTQKRSKSPVFLNMGSYSGFLLQKLSSLIHAASLFLIPVFSYLYRSKKLEVLWNNMDDKGMVFVEAERGGDNNGDKSELHLKFKFPTFEEFSRVQKGRGDSSALESASSRRPVTVSAFIEVLTTLDINTDDKNGETAEYFSGPKLVRKGDDETVQVQQEAAAVELGEIEEHSERGSGDPNKLESLWEHQELIEQLQMELRKVKASGLPTILEESESPKMVEDLKPWRIEEVQHRDCIHNMYKSYREMMRKFDILNYQKMYAMGFLQLKATAPRKPSSAPLLKWLVSRNLAHKKRSSNLMNELQGELEVVYVGQMCLSWEFLHCQYHKALDLWNSDPHALRRYNEVAAQFQQFQVLLQRFTEDQPFQGPRVQSYVKTRCVLRNLLQVPLIREDCLEGDMRKEDEYGVSSEMLVEMVEESIRIFWQFVRSDKDCSLIASHNKLPQINTPEDLKLLVEVRKILLKKEKKVKDALRSESCILKKLRKRREEEDDSEQALQFFAQVDVKLVCRVLNMSRISKDQLVWCQNKLNRISFVNRKIYVEPAFLLFPC